MKSLASLCGVAVAACLALTPPVIVSQTTSIQLFGPVNVRLSTTTASAQNPDTFNSTTLNLTCPAPASSISAVISNTAGGSGNLLVDNFIDLTTTAGTTNICTGGNTEPTGENDCFNSTYQSEASAGELTGQDPDSFVSTGGVAPISVANLLQPGPVQVQISLIDTGGYATSSTLYLTTNCTQNGVSGPGNISGNPISSTNPTAQQLTQTFPFDGTTGQQVQFTYDLSQSQSAGTLTITNNSIPNLGDQAINPTTFQALYLANSSFATANCLVHTGELLNGEPACKLYTLDCQVGTSPTQSGTLCPTSSASNELFEETFDGPGFTLPDITTKSGTVFHQGIGFLMAGEPWNPTAETEPCTFDAASQFVNDTCPQNLLTNFSGSGAFISTGRASSANSTFVAVAPVPEDLTTLSVAGQTPYGWINTSAATITFTSTPPNLTNTTTPIPGQSAFVPAPIESISYGISAPSAVPAPGAIIPTDTTVYNPISCPVPPQTETAGAFTTTQAIDDLANGQYLLHYYAQDCAGTQELQFTQNSSSAWVTSFYTVPINVDTVPPAVATGPTLSPAPSTNYGVANSYALDQPVTASYSCTDSISGVVTCGTSTFSPTPNTGTLTSPVNTSSPGTQTFTVRAVDAAGNQSSASANYQVVAPPVSLVIANVLVNPPLASSVKSGSTITYGIGVVNLSKNAATAVSIRDPLPAGLSFVSASAVTGPAQCSFANNTVTCAAASLPTFNAVKLSTTAIAIEIVVKVTAVKGTTVSNTATVSSDNPSSAPSQSTATVKVQ